MEKPIKVNYVLDKEKEREGGRLERKEKKKMRRKREGREGKAA